MCYFEKTEYRIRPVSGYKILRFCPGCGGRSVYGSTGNFRVNANGRQVDVWLIYQCEKCGHTYNLAIYERVRPKEIPGRNIAASWRMTARPPCGGALTKASLPGTGRR